MQPRLHITDDFEVKICAAKRSEDCPYAGNPHFPVSESEIAFKVSEAMLEAELGMFPTMESDEEWEDIDPPEEIDYRDFYDEVVPQELKDEGLEQERLLQRAREEGRALTPLEMKDHEEYVEEITSFLRRHGGETSVLLADRGVYLEERGKKKAALIRDYILAHSDVPSDREALLAGGMGGAGKTSVVETFGFADSENYIHINPDDMKQLMAENGLIPEIPGLLPMEASTLVHNEASDMAYNVLHRAVRRGKNVFLDQTLANIRYAAEDIKTCRERGYSIDAFFVDVPAEVSDQRAKDRYTEGTNKFLETGEGNGGRPVPRFFMRKQSSTVQNSKNAENFVRLTKIRGLFRTPPRVFDNSVNGEAPRELVISLFS